MILRMASSLIPHSAEIAVYTFALDALPFSKSHKYKI